LRGAERDGTDHRPLGGAYLDDTACNGGLRAELCYLVDATMIIRSVVVPARMKLLGSANRYLPSWLE